MSLLKNKISLLVFLGILFSHLPAYGARTIEVSAGSLDNIKSDTVCTLREAIILANRSVSENINLYNGCQLIADQASPFITINLPKNFKLTLNIPGTNEDFSQQGDLDIRAPIIIEGKTMDESIINGHGLDRVFDVLPPLGNLELHNLTVKGGGTTTLGCGIWSRINTSLHLNSVMVTENGDAFCQRGGGLYVSGFTVIENSSILDNEAGATFVERQERGGGGIFQENALSVLHLTRSTIADNQTNTSGGGIKMIGGSLHLIQSAVVNNFANGPEGNGGGLSLNSGNIEIVSSTISGNQSSILGEGGSGIFVNKYGRLSLKYSTITENELFEINEQNVILEELAAGLQIEPDENNGVDYVRNSMEATLLAQNKRSGENFEDCVGEFTTLGNNLIGLGENCVLHPRPDERPADRFGINGAINLGPLEFFNGEKTPAHILNAGSIAIKGGPLVRPNRPAPPADQHDFPRSALGLTDVGALSARCGDKVVNGENEQCDDGNDDATDGCNGFCEKEIQNPLGNGGAGGLQEGNNGINDGDIASIAGFNPLPLPPPPQGGAGNVQNNGAPANGANNAGSSAGGCSLRIK